MRRRRIFRKKLYSALALGMLGFLALWAGGSAFAVEKAALNLDFEGGTLSGWTGGGAVVEGSRGPIYCYGNNWVVSPAGSYQGILEPGSSGSVSGIAGVKAALNFNSDSQDYIEANFSNRITNAAYFYQEVELAAGESFTMSWNYVSTDYIPFNDGSFTTFVNTDPEGTLGRINGNRAQVTILGATVPGTGSYSTGSYGSTGWQTTTYTAGEAGTYRLGFAAFNLDDTGYSPILFVDGSPGNTTRNGSDFLPIAADPNAPLPPATSLTYSSRAFREAGANDGSVSTVQTLTLKGETFLGTIGEEVPGAAFSNVPPGLTPVLIKTGAQTASLSFTGKALSHTPSDSVADVGLSLGNGAFAGGIAGEVANASVTDISITFYTYSITYNTDGGVLGEGTTVLYNSDTPTFSLVAPSRAGYLFQGWFGEGPEAVTQIPVGTEGNLSFTARWSPISYTLSYRGPSGMEAGGNPATYTIESLKILLEEATLEGYAFAGWYGDSGFSGSRITEIPTGSTGNRTLYARFLPVEIMEPLGQNFVSQTGNLYAGAGFTPEEEGKDISLGLKVRQFFRDEGNEEELALLDEWMAERKLQGNASMLLLDFRFLKVVDGVETEIHEAAAPVKLVLRIPPELQGKAFRILRVHEGVVESLDYLYDENTETATFYTDRFSTYALAYGEVLSVSVLPATGGLPFLPLLLMGGGSLTLFLKRIGEKD